jgi:cyclophilin family peptidyl-prolyl cis-trans isomerase
MPMNEARAALDQRVPNGRLCSMAMTIAIVCMVSRATLAADPEVVVMTTSAGSVTIELWPDKAPKTVANFLNYVDQGFYDGTIFHRVIPGFMIQGGGLTVDQEQKPTNGPIENEADAARTNQRGTIAMARMSDPHSAEAQFFINLVDNQHLDFRSRTRSGWGYAVFGRVVEGMEVVDAIGVTATDGIDPQTGRPAEPPGILSIRRKPQQGPGDESKATDQQG